MVPITPGILYSYTNLNKSWRTHSVIERSLPSFSKNPWVEVLEVGRNWSLFIANEVNDHPKNMSRIVRISSTIWNNDSSMLSAPWGVLRLNQNGTRPKDGWHLMFHVFACPPCPPPPQPNKRISCKSRKCSSVLERVLEHVSLRSPGYTKKTPTIFSGIQHTISDGLCQCYSSLLDFFFLSNYELLGRCIGWFGSPFTGSWDLEHHKKELRVKMMGIHLCFKATYCKPCMKHSWF